jgi:hypothetical protein
MVKEAPDITEIRKPEDIQDKASKALTTLVNKIEKGELKAPSLFRDDKTIIPVNQATWGLLDAINAAPTLKDWTDNEGETAPTHKTTLSGNKGAILVSMKGEEDFTRDTLPLLWNKVKGMSDLTSDVLLACLAQWATTNEGNFNSPITITADAILDARGIKRIRKPGEPDKWQHGHRSEDRIEVGRAIAQLDSLWIELFNVETMPKGKGHKSSKLKVESRALNITARAIQQDFDGKNIFLAAHVTPGEWLKAYYDAGLRQMGILVRKALSYDPYRFKVEKDLTKYLAFHFKYNAGNQNEVISRKVKTLLEGINMAPDTRNPQRTRVRLEKALDQLQQDKVIKAWDYSTGRNSIDKTLPAKSWLGTWLEATIQITPPDDITAHYATLKHSPLSLNEADNETDKSNT